MRRREFTKGYIDNYRVNAHFSRKSPTPLGRPRPETCKDQWITKAAYTPSISIIPLYRRFKGTVNLLGITKIDIMAEPCIANRVNSIWKA